MSDTQTKAPAFRRGAEEAEAASAAAGGSFAKIVYLSSLFEKSGDKVVLRFLTDFPDWITVDQYGFLPTKPKPDGWEGKWPERMGAVSRQDPALKGMFDSDPIAEQIKVKGKPPKAQPRTWALACVREEVIGDGSEELGGDAYKGKILGYKDATRTVKRKIDGEDKEVEEKAIVVINQAYSNFFSPLEGFGRVYGTLLDRDYVIIKKGEELKTDYQSVALDPIDKEHPETGEKVRFDLRDPAFAKRYEHDIDLTQLILDMASDDYYAKFFDKTVEWKPPAKDDEDGKPSASDQEKPGAEPDEDRLKAMAARVKANSGDTTAEEPKAEEAPAEESKAEEQPKEAKEPVAASSGPRDFG